MAKNLFRYNTSELGRKVQEQLQAMPFKTQRAMNAVGGFLNGEAKDRAPVDEGFLTADISNKTVQHKKSYAAVVYVPSNATSAEYAIPMHENKYYLGKNSMAKQRKVSVPVGRKFITRALNDNRKQVRKIIFDEVKL
jgi:hypothetical protein